VVAIASLLPYVALPIVATMVGGVAILGNFAGAELGVLLAFGAAVLLYLAAEELLVEVHEGRKTPAARALFFAGFLLIVLLDVRV